MTLLQTLLKIPSRAVLAISLLAAGLSLVAPVTATASELIFPRGSYIGLVPPPGMIESSQFAGFADPARKASILLSELPPTAYEEFLRAMNRGEIDVPGVSNARREILMTEAGAAHLVIGDQEAGGEKFRKWLLVTRQTIASEKAGLMLAFVVTVQVPQSALEAYPDEAIRKALSSVASRNEIPGPEILGALPLTMGDLVGFTVVRELVPGQAVLLSEEPLGRTEPTDKPFVTLSVAVGPVPGSSEERLKFSDQLLRTIQGYRDLKIVFAEQLRLRNQPVYEIRLQGRYESTGEEMMLVQWVRFGRKGFVRMVAISPKADWAENFPRFRALRDGIEMR